MEAGDVLNTCQTCAASVADADIKGAAGQTGKGLLRCLLARARGEKDEKFRIKDWQATFEKSINSFDPARHAKLLKGDELVLYRAAMAWLRWKDEDSYNHIQKRPRQTPRHTHVKSKTTELGEKVRGYDIHRGMRAGPPLLQTQYRCFDGDEPDAQAAEAAGDAVVAEYDALRDGTSPTSTAVEDTRRLRAVRRGEEAAARALRSDYPQTRRRAEDVARGVAAAQLVTYTSKERKNFLNEHFRTDEEIEASEVKSQYCTAYRADPDSVRNMVFDGSSTLGQDNRKRKQESHRAGLQRRRRRGEVREGDNVLVGRSKAQSEELRRESRARQRAGEGTWVRCTSCNHTWPSVQDREQIRCYGCQSGPECIVTVPAPEASSSSEEEDGVVVKVKPGGFYRGVALGVECACALVKLDCGDQGSLHYSQTETRQLPALNATVWVKVVRIENNGRKIVLSTKNINQETGKPPDAAGEPVCQGKLDESEWGRSTAACRPRKGGRVVLCEALGDADGFTDIELAQVFVVSKTKPGDVLNDLFCATRDGTRLRGIPAIRKYLKGLRDDAAPAAELAAPANSDDESWRGCICGGGEYGEMVACDGGCDNWYHFACVGLTQLPEGEWFCQECKAKPKRRCVESDGSAGLGADDDEEEKARLQRALAMSMERLS